jgi:hypothetical protein
MVVSPCGGSSWCCVAAAVAAILHGLLVVSTVATPVSINPPPVAPPPHPSFLCCWSVPATTPISWWLFQCLGIVEHIKCCSGFRITIHVPARDVGARLQVPIDRIYHRVDSIVGFLSGCLPRPLVVVPTLSSLNTSVPLHPRPPCIRPRLCHRLPVFLAVLV